MDGVLTALPSPPPSWASLQVGGITFHPYALFVLAAIVVAAWLTERRLTDRGGPTGQVLDVVVWAVPLGVVGARLAHVATSPGDFFGPGGHPVRALYLWNGGLEMWGALLVGGLGVWIGCRRAGIAPAPFLDAAAPGLLVGMGVARVGSWFNQDLVGLPTGLPWGVEIAPVLRPAAFSGLATFHPLSLYEALWALVGAALLLRWERRARRGPGAVFLAATTLYALGRLWIDPLRAGAAAQVLGLPVSVVVSLLVVVLGVAGLALSAGTGTAPTEVREAPVPVGVGARSAPDGAGGAHQPVPLGGGALPLGLGRADADDHDDHDDEGASAMPEPTTTEPTGPTDAAATDVGRDGHAPPGAPPDEQDLADEADLPAKTDPAGGAEPLDEPDRPGSALERAERERASLEQALGERERAEDEAERAAARLDRALEALRRAEDERAVATSRRAEADRLADQAAERAGAERATARTAQGEVERAASERAAEQARREQEERVAADAELAGAREAAGRAAEAVQEAEGTAEQHRHALERARRTADERAAAQASLAVVAREAQHAEQEEAEHLAQEVERAQAHATGARLAGAEAEEERVAAERAAAVAQQDVERAESDRLAALAALDRAAQVGVERAAAEVRRSEQAEGAAAADLAEVERAQAAAQGAAVHEELVRSEAERASSRADRLAEDAAVAEAARTASSRPAGVDDDGQAGRGGEEPAEVAVVRHAVEVAEAAESAAATASAERDAALREAQEREDAVSAATEQRRQAEEGFTRTEHLLAERVARAEAQVEVERDAARQVAAERFAARSAAARRAGLTVPDEPPVLALASAGGASVVGGPAPSTAEHDEGHAPEVPRRRARSWLAGRFTDAARRLEDGR